MVLTSQKRSKTSGVVAAHLFKNIAPAKQLAKFNTYTNQYPTLIQILRPACDFNMATCSCSSSSEVAAARAKLTTQNESKWNFNQFIDTMSIWIAFPKPTLPQKPRLSHIKSPSGGSVKRLASQTLAKTHGIVTPKVIKPSCTGITKPSDVVSLDICSL